MQDLTFYTSLLHQTQQNSPELAEQLDEEVNILIHKLKFIAEDQRPTVVILMQQTGFTPVYSQQLHDCITIAGGTLLKEAFDNPDLLIVVQENDRLYTALPDLLDDELLSRTDAVKSNNVYIIQQRNFGTDCGDFLQDVEICAEIIQPRYFVYGRKGKDWVKFNLA